MTAAAKKEEIPDGWVEVEPEPSVPVGWKKKMYSMNGRLNQKWVQYYDRQGNRYNTLQSVEAEAKKQLQRQIGNGGESRKSPLEMSDMNLRPVKSTRETAPSCDICNIELNNLEELQKHITQNHSTGVNTSKKKLGDDWEISDDDMEGDTINYEEEIEDEFLENMASENIAKFQSSNSESKPPVISTYSWYASVEQILRRFKLEDYQIPSKMCSLMEHKDEAKFVEFITPLLRSVNQSSKSSAIHILAKAKWFETMRGQGVTPVNGSLTTLRKPRMIMVNTL